MAIIALALEGADSFAFSYRHHAPCEIHGAAAPLRGDFSWGSSFPGTAAVLSCLPIYAMETAN